MNSTRSMAARQTLSCKRCAERKVKCDRKTPQCSTCSRHNFDCVFPSPVPRIKHNRLMNNKVLSDRLQLYETVLREHGVDPSKLHVSHAIESSTETAIPTPSTNAGSEYKEPDNNLKTVVIRGPRRFKIIDNILWTRVVEEFRDHNDILGDSSDDVNDLEPETPQADQGFILDTQGERSPKLRHPSPERIRQLWRIFTENIDPLTKVVHVPTLGRAIEKTVSNPGAISPEFQALMFAIYAAAVYSLTDDDFNQRLGEPRKSLLSRYIASAKTALSSARFMGTTSLDVLQALFIYMIAVRDIYEPRAVWSLSGVAIRIAQSMGLDRDGEHLGLSPFETEMRRRIWWQLKLHDFRTAELCGIAKFQDLQLHTGPESPKWPTNVDDSQLDPGMSSPATAESNKLTDAMFVCLKCELLNYAASRISDLRLQGKTSNPWDPQTPRTNEKIQESTKDIEQLLESKYIRYCDPSHPLHLIVMLMARCSINVIRFMTYHPRRWENTDKTPPLSERQLIHETCLKLLEQYNMLQSTPLLKPFAWHAPYFQQWHAIIHVLDSLCADPLHADADKAWRLIGFTYNNNPDMIYDLKRPLHLAVGNLCLKAYGKREAAMDRGSGLMMPQFISQLRQRRGETGSKRARSDGSGANSFMHPENITDQTTDSDNEDPSEMRTDYLLGHNRTLPGQDHSSGTINGSDFMQVAIEGSTQEEAGDNNNNNGMVTWDQWDTWLAESNVYR